MRKVTMTAIMMVMVSVAMNAQADIVARLLFDGAPGTGYAVYTPGPGDIVSNLTLVQSTPWPAGVTQPTLHSHDIVAGAGPQGGNVLQGNTTTQQRMGIFMTFTNPIVTSWTAECQFKMTNLNPPYAEYKIQDIMQGWFINGSNTRFEIRYFGSDNGAALPASVLNLTDSNASGAGEVQANSAPNLLVVEQWHHLAVVYDQSANTLKAYLDSAVTPICQITPGLAGSPAQLGNIILGAWANNAGNSRDFCGQIDAFAISDEALAPGSFVFNAPASVQEWPLYK